MIVVSSVADARYVALSTQNASGTAAPSVTTKMPASGYPITSAIVSPTHSAEFAVSRSRSGTICGRIATRAGRKKIEIVVTAKTIG